MSRSSDSPWVDDRWWYGRDPDPWYADEEGWKIRAGSTFSRSERFRSPRILEADVSWGEAADEEDGEA